MKTRSASAVTLMAWWSFERLLFSPRSLGMLLLVGLPVIVSLFYRLMLSFGFERAISGFTLFSVLTAILGFQFISPMLALFYGTGLISDDIEAGTMPYFLTRPRSRQAMLFGKMIASVSIQLALFLPALVITFYIAVAPDGAEALGERFPALIQQVAAAILGALAYNSLCAFLGTAFKRPLLIGLFYIFGWQLFVTYVPGTARKLTIAHYLHSLLPTEAFDGVLQNLFANPSGAVVAIGTLILITAVGHGLAMAIFSRKEISGQN